MISNQAGMDDLLVRVQRSVYEEINLKKYSRKYYFISHKIK